MDSTEMQEVKTMREVPRTPECCGQRMTRMQHPSAASGKVLTVYVCGRCSRQERA